MKTSFRTTPIDEKTERREQLRAALGNAALEGIKPCPEALADMREVVSGNLSTEEYRQRAKARYGIQR